MIKKQKKFNEAMTTSSVNVGSTNSDIINNTDSYAKGDTRKPFVFGTQKRNGFKKNKKLKEQLLVSLYTDHNDDDWTIEESEILDQSFTCVTKVITPRTEKLVEDIVKIITPKYTKSRTKTGTLVLKFETDENKLKNYSNRLYSLLKDTFNKTLFVHLETNKPSPNEQVLISELYK
jgi:hypothetical protein